MTALNGDVGSQGEENFLICGLTEQQEKTFTFQISLSTTRFKRPKTTSK